MSDDNKSAGDKSPEQNGDIKEHPGTGGGDADSHSHSSKGNEDKKIFVGGISSDTQNQDLQTFFGKYGEVTKVEVKIDRITGRSRGFAFVEFATSEACRKSLKDRQQTIKNKTVEIKPAKSRENKKVFIGGLPADYPEEDLRKHFAKFGAVEDVEWPFDKQRGAKRNFAFVVFEDEESANRASSENKQMFGERECDVKKAVPQNRRIAGPMGGPMMGRGGYRGGRGGGYGGGGYGPYGAYGPGMYANQGYGNWAANSYGMYGATDGYAYGDAYSSQYAGGAGDYWGNTANTNVQSGGQRGGYHAGY